MFLPDGVNFCYGETTMTMKMIFTSYICYTNLHLIQIVMTMVMMILHIHKLDTRYHLVSLDLFLHEEPAKAAEMME